MPILPPFDQRQFENGTPAKASMVFAVPKSLYQNVLQISSKRYSQKPKSLYKTIWWIMLCNSRKQINSCHMIPTKKSTNMSFQQHMKVRSLPILHQFFHHPFLTDLLSLDSGAGHKSPTRSFRRSGRGGTASQQTKCRVYHVIYQEWYLYNDCIVGWELFIHDSYSWHLMALVSIILKLLEPWGNSCGL